VGQKTRRDNLDMFSRLKYFVEERDVETSDTGVDQCITDHLVSLQSRFSKYFPEAANDKYKCIMDPFYADSQQNYEFLLKKKKYIDFIYDTSVKLIILGNCIWNFEWAVEGSSPPQ
jgi:hypothetical protein